MNTISILLAAGKGTRMHSPQPKVLHKICGQEMLRYVADAVGTQKENTIIVTGFGAEKVEDAMGIDYRYVLQEEQLGTGHAVMQADAYLNNPDDLVIIAAGDMPLVQRKSIEKMKEKLAVKDCAAVLLCAELENPTGFGRVIVEEDEPNSVVAIVEERDATEEQRKIKRINSSVYCFRAGMLKEALGSLKTDNQQNEYYLTDCIAYLRAKGKQVTYVEAEAEDLLGVNSLLDLAQVTKLMQRRINEAWMKQGVQIISPETTLIGPKCCFEAGVEIYPNNVIEGEVSIGAGTVLFPGNFLEDGKIGQNCKIGPNAHLRKGAVLGNNCRVGNFVELKNVSLDDGAKVSHLAYCGDGEIGKRANISCGVIFSNYDGASKAKTIVGDDAFVGCNANLVAPVKVEKGAYIAAGSTITQDVPENALAIARERQTNKPGWNWLERIKNKAKKH